jgi:hypothetical protein
MRRCPTLLKIAYPPEGRVYAPEEYYRVLDNLPARTLARVQFIRDPRDKPILNTIEAYVDFRVEAAVKSVGGYSLYRRSEPIHMLASAIIRQNKASNLIHFDAGTLAFMDPVPPLEEMLRAVRSVREEGEHPVEAWYTATDGEITVRVITNNCSMAPLVMGRLRVTNNSLWYQRNGERQKENLGPAAHYTMRVAV